MISKREMEEIIYWEHDKYFECLSEGTYEAEDTYELEGMGSSIDTEDDEEDW